MSEPVPCPKGCPPSFFAAESVGGLAGHLHVHHQVAASEAMATARAAFNVPETRPTSSHITNARAEGESARSEKASRQAGDEREGDDPARAVTLADTERATGAGLSVVIKPRRARHAPLAPVPKPPHERRWRASDSLYLLVEGWPSDVARHP